MPRWRDPRKPAQPASGGQGTGWPGQVAAIEAGLAAAEQRPTAMRDLATRHTTVHLGMPDVRSVVVRIDPERRNEDAKQQS
ncbi:MULTISPECIES: hypothetical protein [unclassified Streptomyces]|uniref:hypothetical protein n=1 Tax=unclassified Streptomyces TaxID=2593676 RepID=UPI00341A60B3